MTSQRRRCTDNGEALAAFVARKSEIDARLSRLAGFSDDHFGVAPDAVTWGDVGTLGDVAERLRRIGDVLFREGGCAE